LLAATLSACSNSDAKSEQPASAKDSLAMVSTNNRVMGVACIEPEEGILNITPNTDGKVLEVVIESSQEIKKGDPVLILEAALEDAQLNQATSKLAAQQATILASEASLAALKISLQNAQTTYERDIKLVDAKAQTKQALDNSKTNLDKMIQEAKSAEATLSQAKSRLKELQADIAYYRTLVDQKKVVAPLSGKLLNMKTKPGDYVSASTQIAEFAPEGRLIARTEVDELYAERVQTGQPAYIFSQTTGDTLAYGQVSFTADYLKQKSLFGDQSTELEDRRVREVHILLVKGKMPLIGSRVDCTILLK
jgi:multidrug resistance efflux pump